MIEKQDLQNIRKELKPVLDEIFKKYDISFEIGSMRFTEKTVKFSIEGIKNTFGEKSDNDRAYNKDELEFFEFCDRYGLKKDDFGKTINILTVGAIKIDGLRKRNRKYPILATRLSDGKRFKFHQSTILNELNQK